MYSRKLAQTTLYVSACVALASAQVEFPCDRRGGEMKERLRESRKRSCWLEAGTTESKTLTPPRERGKEEDGERERKKNNLKGERKNTTERNQSRNRGRSIGGGFVCVCASSSLRRCCVTLDPADIDNSNWCCQYCWMMMSMRGAQLLPVRNFCTIDQLVYPSVFQPRRKIHTNKSFLARRRGGDGRLLKTTPHSPTALLGRLLDCSLPGFVVILGLYSNRIAEFLTLWIFPKWNDWAFIVVVGLFFSKSTEWRARRLEKKLWNGRKKMTCPFYWLESVVVVTLCDYSPAACPSASINIPRGQGVVRPFDQFQLRFFLSFFLLFCPSFCVHFIYLFIYVWRSLLSSSSSSPVR